MSTSSGDPELLHTFASDLQRHADGLLVDVSLLDVAEAAYSRGCPDDGAGVLAPPVAVDDLRGVARRLVTLADDAERVGRAFRAADARHRGSGTVTVSTGALARAIRGIDPTRSLLDRLRRSTITERSAVLRELERATADALVARHPEWVGSTDGVPWKLRVRANHRLVLAAIRRFHGDPAELEVLRRLARSKVLVFDPQRGLVAVLHGDLDVADNVAVFVPGMMSTFGQFFHGGASTDDKARALFDEARRRSPHQSTAVIAWLGYHAPQSIVEAISPRDAQRGGASLVPFVDGLGLTADQRLTLVGHSYGTVTIGEALKGGLHVDELVIAGSPGIGVNHASSLGRSVSGDVSVLAAPGDPVAIAGGFGATPSDPAFGARRLKVNAKGEPRVEAHAHYFEPGSEAVRNMAAVIVGAPVDVQPASATDEAVSFVDRMTDLATPEVGDLIDGAERYHGPGADAVHTAGVLARGVRRVPGSATRLAVDGVDALQHAIP
jgi:hypothetical protein